MQNETTKNDSELRKLPIIAVLRGINPEQVVSVGEALTQSGIMIMEVTLNSPSPYTSIQRLSQRFATEILVGAGTVTRVEQVHKVKQAGGRLIVAPNMDTDVIQSAKSQGLLAIPGCFTPTEVFTAIKAGADAIKLFPAEMLSPAAVKAMRAALPADLMLFVVGGINAGNMLDYLRQGADGVGTGSSLYKPGKTLSDIAADATALVQTFNAGNPVKL